MNAYMLHTEREKDVAEHSSDRKGNARNCIRMSGMLEQFFCLCKGPVKPRMARKRHVYVRTSITENYCIPKETTPKFKLCQSVSVCACICKVCGNERSARKKACTPHHTAYVGIVCCLQCKQNYNGKRNTQLHC